MSDLQTIQLDPKLETLIRRLRRRIRLYVWVEGIAALLVVLVLAFWAGLALDWLFEPSPAVRRVALVALAGVLAVVAYRRVMRRAFARLSDANLAVLLERNCKDFQDSLITAVQMRDAGSRATSFNPQMVAHTSREAVDKSTSVRPSDVFNLTPLVRNVAIAVVLVASVVPFSLFASEAMAFYLDRLAGTESLWPRRVRLVVEGFPENEQGIRVAKVARGAAFDLLIKADNQPHFDIPRLVEIRELADSGDRSRGNARRVGEAAPGLDPFQEFAYTFQDVFESRNFDVVGGDDRIRGLRLEAVDSPQIIEMVLDCEYPAYMERANRRLTVTGAMQIPQGTKITLHAKTNKPLVQIKVLDVEGSAPAVIEIPQDAESRDRFEMTLPRFDVDRTLQFVLVDHDGIETQQRDQYRLALTAIPDQAPQFTAMLQGIGRAITPEARIPLAGQVTDDYGIERIWFEHRVDEDEPAQTDFRQQPDRETKLAVNEVLEARRLGVKAGQKLLLGAVAHDACDLAESANEGRSQRFLLEVVTPQRLKAMLESRELLLRRRFETIYAEMTDTRDMIARIEFAVTTPEAQEPEAEVASDPPTKPATGDDAPSGADATAATDSPAELAERAVSRRRLRVARAVQNVQRAGHETLAVAAAIDEIIEELGNNRIDSEDLNRRLRDHISAPLKKIGGPRINRVEEQLGQLEENVDNQQTGPEQLRQTIQLADEVLVEMKAVLDRMLELESYNEVLELLREIVRDQKRLNDKTKQQRKSNLRNLLDD